jgi:hypothetical protein
MARYAALSGRPTAHDASPGRVAGLRDACRPGADPPDRQLCGSPAYGRCQTLDPMKSQGFQPIDKDGVVVSAGKLVRVLSLSGDWSDRLPVDERADVASMVGEVLSLRRSTTMASRGSAKLGRTMRTVPAARIRLRLKQTRWLYYQTMNRSPSLRRVETVACRRWKPPVRLRGQSGAA